MKYLSREETSVVVDDVLLNDLTPMNWEQQHTRTTETDYVSCCVSFSHISRTFYLEALLLLLVVVVELFAVSWHSIRNDDLMFPFFSLPILFLCLFFSMKKGRTRLVYQIFLLFAAEFLCCRWVVS